MIEKNGISKLDSQVIRTLRFPLVCLVVVIHSFSFIEDWDIEQLDLNNLNGSDIYSLFCISLSMTLAHIAVPTFFVISGYLFFHGLQNWNWQIYQSKLKKRIYTLLIPYMVWNSLYITKTLGLKLGEAVREPKQPKMEMSKRQKSFQILGGNHFDTTAKASNLHLQSDTLRPENSVKGVLGRSGGGEMAAEKLDKSPLCQAYSIGQIDKNVYECAFPTLRYAYCQERLMSEKYLKPLAKDTKGLHAYKMLQKYIYESTPKTPHFIFSC